MGKPELGSKLTCTSCAARFYDLSRVPAVCPKCDAVQPPPKPRTILVPRGAPRRWMSPSAAPAASQPDDEAAVADADDDLDAVDPPEIDEDDDDDADVVKPEIAVDG